LDRLSNTELKNTAAWNEVSVRKTEVNWVTRTIIVLTRRKGLERWEKNRKLWGHTPSCVAYCEMPFETERTKGTNCYILQIWPAKESQRDRWLLREPLHTHYPRDNTHARWVEAKGSSSARDCTQSPPPPKVRPCDVRRLINTQKLNKASQMDASGTLQEHRLQHRKGTKVTLLKPGRNRKFPQNLYPIGLLSAGGKLFQKGIIKNSPKACWRKGPAKCKSLGIFLHFTERPFNVWA
jgi:hypothetical protein